MGDSNIKDAADAIKGIAEAVPVYQDAIQPAAKEIGTGLQTLAKTVHIVLAPVSALVWGYDQIKEYVTRTVSEKLKDTPSDRIVTPNPTVAGPVLEALRYAGHQESLADMYANLLATGMDAKTAKEAHPSFVEVLKQLSPDEAKILKIMSEGQNFPVVSVHKYHKINVDGEEKQVQSWVLKHFSLLPYKAGCQYPELGPMYLQNFCRLGLTVIPSGGMGSADACRMAGEEPYKALLDHPEILRVKSDIETVPDQTSSIPRQVIRVVTFGRQFLNACVVPGTHA